MIINLKSGDVLFSEKIQGFCKLPYPNHSKGCPNFGKKKRCPPDIPLIDEILDFNKPIYLIYTEFNIGKFAGRMLKKHPTWTERQAYCCLYWQPKARKEHKMEIEEFMRENKNCIVVKTPEAYGVNLNVLFIKLRMRLEWPPRKITRIASLGGFRK